MPMPKPVSDKPNTTSQSLLGEFTMINATMASKIMKAPSIPVFRSPNRPTKYPANGAINENVNGREIISHPTCEGVYPSPFSSICGTSKKLPMYDMFISPCVTTGKATLRVFNHFTGISGSDARNST